MDFGGCGVEERESAEDEGGFDRVVGMEVEVEWGRKEELEVWVALVEEVAVDATRGGGGGGGVEVGIRGRGGAGDEAGRTGEVNIGEKLRDDVVDVGGVVEIRGHGVRDLDGGDLGVRRVVEVVVDCGGEVVETDHKGVTFSAVSAD